MKLIKKSGIALALILASLLLLSACGYAAGPLVRIAGPVAAAAAETDPAQSTEAEADVKEVHVGSMDEFLAALDSDTVIYLEPGVYDLSSASDYGSYYSDGAYFWSDSFDGYELVIRSLNNLTIAGFPGESGAEILLSAIPRYSVVLRFENCRGLTLSGFTAGHTEEPGQCSGGVLEFDFCVNTRIVDCRLYGCGILGIDAENCDTLFAESCEIYDCSYGAVTSRGCRDVRILDCDIHDCGMKYDEKASSLFEVNTTTGFAVVNSRVHDNFAERLLRSSSADQVCLLGTEVRANGFETVFSSSLIVPAVEDCAFTQNTLESWSWFDGQDHVLSLDGRELFRPDLESMTLKSASYDGPLLPQTASVNGIRTEEGTEYHVKTVDELLAAIGSDTTIYLEGEMFDLSTASNYGGYGGDHYFWLDIYDGPGLVITGVENFRLIGQGKDHTTVQVVPRYADVLAFDSCKNVTVSDLTAGHLKGQPGSCSGDVLAFDFCEGFLVSDCGLFGCGVYGIRVDGCEEGSVVRTEIYECSGGAAQIYRTDGVVFTDCSVHDCVSAWNGEPVNVIYTDNSWGCSYNGYALWKGFNQVGDELLKSRQGA